MKAVFTCGGTGGHINPALAVARVLLERRPDSEILFVGAEDGMEATLVPREGFRLETLQISSYMRSLKPSAIRHNVRAALSIRRALKKADRIIRDFQPDVILGTAAMPAIRCSTRARASAFPRPCTSPMPCRASPQKWWPIRSTASW